MSPTRPPIALLAALLFATLPLAAPDGAAAGAWPRDRGRVFSAYTLRRGLSGGPVMTSIYQDIGLGPRSGLTLELDLAQGRFEKVFAFGRVTATRPGAATQMSFAVGGGTLSGDAAVAGRVMLGHGFRVFGSDAWAEIALTGEHTRRTGRMAGKADLTLGISPTPRLKSYVQVFAYKANDSLLYLRTESSTAIRLFGSTWLDLGLSSGIAGSFDRRIKLGIWMSF
ncbi:hypothetical protein ATO6_01045 [Oceanicola sp. 22II-s10i]|uniref:hypothetical protein n=1 Tax=Oceanicola sp. 22II-s10i TaxID=1317116 RepID=UPI000B5268E0|nr:hypothetical protein [Oceanicola sp. 22II-s10i]OWU85560.1 hypothetical protein ATO6_01045 [Oceanicola sp. 22II-s10i]